MNKTVLDQLEKAKRKHPTFPKSSIGGLAIIAEEFGELSTAFTRLCQGVNDKANNDNLQEEAAHVAVTAIRFLETMADEL